MLQLVDFLRTEGYIGRGIGAGRNELGENVLFYFLTGRSPSSKAREFLRDAESCVIRTNVTDPKQLEGGNEALLIYPAMAFSGDGVVVSNGAQTNLLYSALVNSEFSDSPAEIIGKAFERPSFAYDAKGERWLDVTHFEPDPNKTPRISLVALPDSVGMHIVRCGSDGLKSQQIFSFDFEPGKARLLTTYSGPDSTPLPSFAGNPLEGEMKGFRTPADTAEIVYNALNPNFRVAVVAVHVDPATGNHRHYIINTRGSR